MIFDCSHPDSRHPLGKTFPVNVVVVDPVSKERIPDVFYLDTDGIVQRFIRGATGIVLVNPDGSRMDVYERREWVALNKSTNELVAKSKGAIWQE